MMTDKKMKYREALTLAMSEAMEDPKSMILGQGITDFKGMWGTTLGLSQKHPGRVIETPLSEDAVAGICIGAIFKWYVSNKYSYKSRFWFTDF